MSIKFCFEAGLSAKNAFDMLQIAYSVKTAVYVWLSWFQDGRESVFEDVESVHPSATRSDENIARTATPMNKDCRITCRLVAERLNILK